MFPNNVRKLRQAAMMSKAELARRAGVSPLTIDRVEAGCPSRMDTKRKILEALGLPPSAREEVFGPDPDQG
ncbi:MAG: XRE family transcriptional regulator [Deltaproteobacteria bacterium]|nr:MAG: XRE family transcriptional regulator [Deltaproteobacteria bacterium]